MIQGRPVCTEFQIGGNEPASLTRKRAHLDRQTGGAQLGDAAALDLREGIGFGRPPTRRTPAAMTARVQGGVLAEVAARFERHVERSAGGTIARHAKGFDLGMGLAELPMPPLGDDFGPLRDHAADHRVGLDESLAPSGQVQRAAHVPEVDFRLVHVLGQCSVASG